MASYKKKIRPGVVELSEDATALEVHYESLDILVQPDGTEHVHGNKHGVKRLPIQLTVAEADDEAAAAEATRLIAASSKLIHPARTAEVQVLVSRAWEQLHVGSTARSSGTAGSDTLAPAARPLAAADTGQSLLLLTRPPPSAAPQPPLGASIAKLEEYIEALYDDDLSARLHATAAVAALAEHHLPMVASHPTLLPALARLLREDHKRSSELALNLLTTFLLLSHQPAHRSLLAQNQVGSLSMDIVALELRRAEHWQAREGTSVLDVCARLRAGEPLGEREVQLAAALERQEVLLFAALHVLLNMAEEPAVGAKMMRRGLLGHLVLLLDRAGPELLLLAATFLLRLSARPEGRTGMLEAGVAPRAAALLPAEGCELLRVQLRLMHNLALEPEGRLALVNAGAVGKVAVLLEGAGESKQTCGHQRLALSLLCQLSADDKHRSLFLYTGVLPRLGTLLLEAPPGGVAPELAALAANLTESPRVAEELARCGLVEPLLARALAAREPAVWHLVHNLAAHESEGVRQRFVSSLPGLVSLLMAGDTTPQLAQEALGVLAYLYVRGYDYLLLLQSSGLHVWLLACLNSDATPDAGLLAGVAALGTLCSEGTAQLLVDAGVVPALHRLAVQRGEEDAFALATTLAAHRLLQAGPSRDALLQRPELVARFAELLEHPSKEVSRAADAALDCVAALSEVWAASVRRLRFEAHNRLWIDIIGGTLSVAAAATKSAVGESDWVAPPSLLVLEGGAQES